MALKTITSFVVRRVDTGTPVNSFTTEQYGTEEAAKDRARQHRDALHGRTADCYKITRRVSQHIVRNGEEQRPMDMNTASDALTKARLEFDRLIGELQAMRDHIMVEQDRSAHWGDVGSAKHVNALLEVALNFGTGRGD